MNSDFQREFLSRIASKKEVNIEEADLDAFYDEKMNFFRSNLVRLDLSKEVEVDFAKLLLKRAKRETKETKSELNSMINQLMVEKKRKILKDCKEIPDFSETQLLKFCVLLAV